MQRGILVNDRCLYTAGAGVSIYLRNVLAHWPDDPSLPLVGMVTHRLHRKRTWPTGPESKDKRHQPLPLHDLTIPGTRQSLARLARHWVAHPAYKQAIHIELWHGGYAGLWEPNQLAAAATDMTVTTIHDLSLLEHPQWHPTDRVKRWEHDIERTLAVTNHWIAVSEFTRSRMIELLGVDAETVSVALLAARRLIYPQGPVLEAERAALGLPRRYLLHVGTLEPRKNISILLDAYAHLTPAERGACGLVLAGGIGWGSNSFWQSLINHRMADYTLTTGYVSDGDLGVLIAGAEALLQPSFYEGFGLPILEAMACGCPVFCSDIASFHEVGGGVSWFIDPSDGGAWADVMRQVIDEPACLRQRGDAGRKRAAQFTWQKTAEAHHRVWDGLSAQGDRTRPDQCRAKGLEN